MKRIRTFLLWLGLAWMAGVVNLWADDEPGWYQPDAFSVEVSTNTGTAGAGLTKPPDEAEAGFSPLVATLSDDITPEIQALARGLLNDPARIFAFVRNEVEYEHYFGSKKGAQLTLLERSGNDFDQCSLLVALLRAAGYTAQYQFGWMLIPYSSFDRKDAVNWLGLDPVAYPGRTLQSLGYTTNDFPSATSEQDIKNYLFASANCIVNGWPKVLANAGLKEFVMQRVWVRTDVSGTAYWLDPSGKTYQNLTPTNYTNWFGYTRSTLLAQAGGTVTSNSIQQVNYSNLSNDLVRCTTNFLTALRSNYPNAASEQIIGGRVLETASVSSLVGQMLFSVHTNLGFASFPVETWNAIPTNYTTLLQLGFGSAVTNLWMPQLQGQTLAITFTNTLGQVWLGDSLVLSEPAPATGSNAALAVLINHPHFFWVWTNNAFLVVSDTRNDQRRTNALLRTSSNGIPQSALFYSFRANANSLRYHEQKLDDYLRRGLSPTSRQVVTETLNIIGLNWCLQTDLSDRLLASQHNIIVGNQHLFGLAIQEDGYHIDVGMWQNSSYERSGDVGQTFKPNFVVGAYFASAMEHGIIEQRQGGTNMAVSTVKVLHLANSAGEKVFKMDSTNFNSVSSQLTNYTTAKMAEFQQSVNGGAFLILPRNGKTTVNTWTGFGYMERRTNLVGMYISGGLNGGYNTFPAYLNPVPEWRAIWNQPTYFNPTPPASPATSAADPVNMADGSFTYNHNDLAVGQAEPRGLSFERHYSSSRRQHNLAQLGYGWTHNYLFNLASATDARARLGLGTPAEMAAFLVATHVAYDVYASTNTAQAGLITALIANWAVDQIKNNSVNITLGAQAVGFTRQPDGNFTSPAGVTMTLTRSNNVHELRQRHGNVFRFDATNRLAEIEDVHGKKMTFTYLSDGRVQQAKDAYNRTLTFSYGTSNRLDSVSDSTGRSIQFGYDSDLNLTSATDPESKTNTFVCDTNHQMTLVRDADGRTVVKNFYDAFGRVTEQHTAGDSNKLWRLFYGGSVHIEQDPLQGMKSYFYDERGRSTGMQDANGNRSRMAYDGQDHIIETRTPLNQATTFTFDADHNLLRTRDPAGFGATNYYDSQHRRTQAVDGRGLTNSFTYNAKHQITEQVNPLGQRSSMTYHTTTGTLTSRTDPGTNTTSYSYDAYDELERATSPDSADETYVRNARGDVLVQRNARGISTTNTYNLRRQLTGSATVSNVVTSVAYDNSGNVLSTTDARGFTSSNGWNATGQLLTRTLPATTAGRAILTNVYDARDFLSLSFDALGRASQSFYGPNGWLAATIAPLQRTNVFQYDGNGRKTVHDAPLNRTWTFGYDARGRQTEWGWPSIPLPVRYGYDGNGNRTGLTNRLFRRTTFAYDRANRLVTNRTHLGRETVLTYEPRGLVRTVREPSGQTATNSYDLRGRLTNRVDALGAIASTYDAGGLLLTVNEGGQTLARTYDGPGRLETFTDGSSNQLRYGYDANVNLTRLQYPDGKVVSYAYDGRNQLTNVTDWASRKTSLSYDLNGRMTQLVRPNGTKRLITYDEGGQTTRVEERDGQNKLIALFRYRYDAAGEMTNRFMVPVPQAVTPGAQTATVDADNRLATFNSLTVTHDTDGNMTSGPVTNASLNTYVWDARNRLVSVGGLGYRYDAENRRTAITNGTNVTRFVINPAPALSQVLVRVKPDGVQTLYVHGLGLLYEVATNGTTRTYHYDYVGSTVAITDDSGQVTDRVEYAPYGSITYRAGSTDTPFLYNGRYGVMTDANGLLQMRSRYYNPYLGRFVSEDAAGFAGGLNFYAYAEGNPLNYLDPFGFGAQEPGVMSRIGTALLNASVFGPPPPEYVVYHDDDTGLYLNAHGLPLPQSEEYRRVDSSGRSVDLISGVVPSWIGGPSGGLPTPTVTNPKLANLVKDLFKGSRSSNPIGTGSTADAVRNELTTGLPTQGVFHSQKAQEYINAISNWQRRNPNASDYDRIVAESLKLDLQSAIGGR
jgi:RHS repeat-associated protein